MRHHDLLKGITLAILASAALLPAANAQYQYQGGQQIASVPLGLPNKKDNTNPPRNHKVYLKAGQDGYLKQVSGLPWDFPLPVPPGAKLIGTDEITTAGNGKRSFYANWHTGGNVADTVAWYQQALKAAGWNFIPPQADPAGRINITASSKNAGAAISFTQITFTTNNRTEYRVSVIATVTLK